MTGTPPNQRISLPFKASYISDCIPKSCLPGLLAICDKNVIQIDYPSTTLIQPRFHAFTASGLKESSVMRRPIVELMGLVNQLFAMSFVTEPMMLY
jgi:hypothetical protein